MYASSRVNVSSMASRPPPRLLLLVEAEGRLLLVPLLLLFERGRSGRCSAIAAAVPSVATYAELQHEPSGRADASHSVAGGAYQGCIVGSHAHAAGGDIDTGGDEGGGGANLGGGPVGGAGGA